MTIKGVDLAPVEKKRFVFDWMIFFLIIIIVCFFGLFLAYGNKLDAEIKVKHDEIAKIDAEIKEIKSKIPDKDKIIQDIADLKDQIRAIETISRDPFKYSNLLKEIQIIIPKNICLDSLSIEGAGSAITLAGKSVALPGYPPLACISKFMVNLESSSIFRNVDLSSASQTSDKKEIFYTFQMTTMFNPEVAAHVVKAGQGGEQQ